MTEAPRRSRPGFWQRPFWWANLLAVLLLLLAYLSVRVPPERAWPLAFLGMAYPFMLPVHLFFLIWWALFRPKRMLVSLAAVALGAGHLGDHVQLFGRTRAPADAVGPHLKVMSYNVRLFDLYNWSGNTRTRNEILDLIAFEGADILCLQEFFLAEDQRFFNTKDTLLRHLGYKSCHDSYTAHTRRGHHFGIATFSTLPIVGKGTLEFPDDLNNLCIWTDLMLGGDTVRVYNAHLASVRFGDTEYRFMEELDRRADTDSLRSGGSRIAGLLRNAFLRRAREARMITTHMAGSPHPVLYCGDLNDTPMSYGYGLLTQQLTDAFVESGRGTGSTYIGVFPSFRIDHIMHGPGFTTWNFRTLPEELSDHRAIVCEVARRAS